ncbi:MAG: tetratricopeptide repeat protein [Smithellaceae bacterium]|jgi:tetratricopeptide (TPR) repeat protein|nr:tetratricopeptide repeat protein [Smithellaceae bacterium]MDD3259733.1 tetratricopeptide repeat protein [Smithellaceae bacterium]MDD3848897.1 tetratricopeptide repeat protein [Smithellaceae bacterium]HOG11861.1 tetratricopeptide repeat protein [Smithellaceae bacterium]HOQ72031.1 tetratricopeptide repeat protein [Smithellaceae bacterium]
MTTESSSQPILDEADRLIEEGKPGEAVALLEALHAREPDEEPVLLRLAWASWDIGRKEQSIQYWEELLERELQRRIFTGFAYDELVRIYKQEALFEKLIAVCEKAVAAQPDDAGLLAELGNAQLQSGRALEACRIFEKLTRMEEDNPDFLCRLGEALFAAGRASESEAACLRAGRMDPEQIDRYSFRIADLYSRGKRHAEAIRLLERCIAANPSQPLYYCSLGDELAALGRVDEAEAVYETAAAKSPSGAYYNRLGNTLMKEKMFDRAARAFEKAAAREGLRPFFVNLARAYREMGLPEAAGEALRKAGETS